MFQGAVPWFACAVLRRRSCGQPASCGISGVAVNRGFTAENAEVFTAENAKSAEKKTQISRIGTKRAEAKKVEINGGADDYASHEAYSSGCHRFTNFALA